MGDCVTLIWYIIQRYPLWEAASRFHWNTVWRVGTDTGPSVMSCLRCLALCTRYLHLAESFCAQTAFCFPRSHLLKWYVKSDKNILLTREDLSLCLLSLCVALQPRAPLCFCVSDVAVRIAVCFCMSDVAVQIAVCFCVSDVAVPVAVCFCVSDVAVREATLGVGWGWGVHWQGRGREAKSLCLAWSWSSSSTTATGEMR